MPRFKVPGLSDSKGMTTFQPLPPANYLFKVTEIESKDNENEEGEVVGTNLIISSIVENAQNLPKGVDIGEVVGRSFKDFIFIMKPAHPKYNEISSAGTQIGMIGVDAVKSFLDSVGVPVKADGFNEQACVGKYFEADVAQRTYTSKGEERKGNKVNAYYPASDVGGASDGVEADADIPDSIDDDLEGED